MPSFVSSRASLGLLVAASAATALVCLVAREASREQPSIVPSPREAVEKLTKEEQDALPYPPDAFPGARDVGSPYGSIRVYEFGPVTGRKVLLIHGISTPCIALTSLAHHLVTKGCRVLLLDLFGRGYSDSVDLPHDSRLYTTQLLLALTSSPLPWTPAGFSVIGYSFGGGIAADFAAAFPRLVLSLVLLAPGGLIRARHFDRQSRALFSSWTPRALREWVVRRRLGGGGEGEDEEGEASRRPAAAEETGSADVPTTGAEIRGNRDPVFESTVLASARPGVTIGSVVDWQVRTHAGFVQSFVSSMRHGSIEGRAATWSLLGERDDQVLIVVGSQDSVIDAVELREDALRAIGEGSVVWRVVDAGHEFPVSRAEEVAWIVGEFWGL